MMKTTTIRLPEETIADIERINPNTSEFIRQSVENELARRTRPNADIHEVTARVPYNPSSKEKPSKKSSFDTMDPKDLISIWLKSKKDPRSFGSNNELISGCVLMQERIQTYITDNSLPRKISLVDEMPQGALPRYLTSGESHAVISPGGHPSLDVSTGEDLVPMFEIARLIEIPFDEIKDDTISEQISIVAEQIRIEEEMFFLELLNEATLRQNRMTSTTLKMPDDWDDDENIIIAPYLMGELIRHGGDTAITKMIHSIKQKLPDASLFYCSSANMAHILKHDFITQCVMPIRQDITVIPMSSNTHVGFCIFEEIGLGIMDRTSILTISNDPSGRGYVRVASPVYKPRNIDDGIRTPEVIE